jgi:hypothetical protein
MEEGLDSASVARAVKVTDEGETNDVLLNDVVVNTGAVFGVSVNSTEAVAVRPYGSVTVTVAV